MSWQKGQSGNLNGRPKKKSTAVTQIETMLKKRDQIDPDNPTEFITRRVAFWNKLFDLTMSDDMSAAKLLAEYGFGRPKFVHEVDANINVRPAPSINIIDTVSDEMLEKVGLITNDSITEEETTDE